jgi:hypothetical protein
MHAQHSFRLVQPLEDPNAYNVGFRTRRLDGTRAVLITAKGERIFREQFVARIE